MVLNCILVRLGAPEIMIDRGKLISQNKPFNPMSLTIAREHAVVS